MTAGSKFEEVIRLASNRWQEIILRLTTISAETFAKKTRGQPCPKCGGTDRFALLKDFDKSGAVHCRHCFSGDTVPKSGDGIATIAWANDISCDEARKQVAAFLGLDEQVENKDMVALVAAQKRMPVESFQQFGAKNARRAGAQVARVPVYDQNGNCHSYFDISPGSKGKFKCGKGNSGIFLPGCLPQPGEQWLLVEGVKDAAALLSLGFQAAGTPGSSIPASHAKLFSGCDIVIVPDLDEPSVAGAAISGKRLDTYATSIRIAQLPGPVAKSGGDDVRDVLSRPDGEQLIREAIEFAKMWTESEVNGRPLVLLDYDESKVADFVIQSVSRYGWDSKSELSIRVFQRHGKLTQIIDVDAKKAPPYSVAKPCIRELPSACLRARISSSVVFVAPSSSRSIPKQVRPPTWLVTAILERGMFPQSVRTLSGLVFSPTLRPDGSILQNPGYDSQTGLYFRALVAFPRVPDQPSKDDARRALDELLEVVVDFPFDDDASRSVWLSLVLTLAARPAINGPCPLFAIDANTPGVGKTLLADLASMIVIGDSMPRKTYPSADEEMRKVITSVGREGIPAILLDNITTEFGCASLDAVLTGTRWQDRVLGTNTTTGAMSIRTVWIGTGNNLLLGSDLARRTLTCRLESPLEAPETREGFRYPDVLGWVRAHHARLLVSAITVIRAYFVAGRPPMKLSSYGTYEDWSDVIRNALVWLGERDPRDGRSASSSSDRQATILDQLLGGLEALDPTATGRTVRELVDFVGSYESPKSTGSDALESLVEAVLELCGSSLTTQSLGYELRSLLGRVCRGRRLSKRKASGGLTRWLVERVC